MAHIFFKEMESKNDREEVRYFFLKDDPEVMLNSSYNGQLFFREHRYIRHQLNPFILIRYFLS
jgi:hypothetical protein